MKTKYISAILLYTNLFKSFGSAQNASPPSAPKSGLQHQVSEIFDPRGSLPNLSEGCLVLIPELSKTSFYDGEVSISFAVKNNSNKDIAFRCDWFHQLVGLGAVDQDGAKRFISAQLERMREYEYSGPARRAPRSEIIWANLKPGETGWATSFQLPTI